MALLTTISRVIQQQGDKLNVAIETLEGGNTPHLRLVITPRLNPIGGNASEQEIAFRSALRQPLIVTGTAEECEAQLERHIGNYQRHLDDTTESLQRMEASRTKAENSKPEKKSDKQAGSTSKPSAAQGKGEPESNKATTPETPEIGGVGDF